MWKAENVVSCFIKSLSPNAKLAKLRTLYFYTQVNFEKNLLNNWVILINFVTYMDILLIILEGLAIGILISAPMGPIGMLCIQRTLNKGRASGFFTGVGASLSDLLYALLTGLGMSFIINFVEEHQLMLQMFGSLVLLGFGVYIARKNPAKALKARSGRPVKNNFIQDLVTGFLFTFSNPLIIFLIIGLYARFNFLTQEQSIYGYVAGFLSIIIGALCWWFVITYFVSKVRGHFNVRSMWLINIIIGSLICLMSLVGFGLSLVELL